MARVDKPTLKAGRKSEVLDQLYAEYRTDLHRYLLSKFGAGPPDPADVVQDTFIKFAALDNANEINNPKAFLYATARNMVIDFHRQTQRHDRLLQQQMDLEVDEQFTVDSDPENVSLVREEKEMLQHAINQLPERDRTFLLLNRIEGVSFAEIARRTGLSASGVRFIVEEALASCQAAVKTAERNGGQP